MPREYNGWERTTREQRKELELLLSDSPSLRSSWNESFNIAWSLALKITQKEYKTTFFPSIWQLSRDIDEILDVDFWENA